MPKHLSYVFISGFLALWVAGCSNSWIGADPDAGKRLAGDRIAVLEVDTGLSPDAAAESIEMALPVPCKNSNWHFETQHRTTHLSAPQTFSDAKEYSLGDAADNYRQFSNPVVAGEYLFSVDGEGMVTAYNALAPEDALWSYEILRDDVPDRMFYMRFGTTKKGFHGAALSFNDGTLYLTTAMGQVIALEAISGKEKWQKKLPAPMRSAATIADKRVFVLTIDNRLYALDAADGKTLWSHSGINEQTTILGYPSPTVFRNIVLTPYSSGELYALSAENGRTVWVDSLREDFRKTSSLFALNDIDATPVVSEDGIAYAASHEGVLTAYDVRNGRPLWRIEASTVNTPWLAGDFLFILTTHNEIAAIERNKGLIKWVKKLPSYEDVEDKEGRIIWHGPVLAGNKLFVVGSHGELYALSPFDGELMDAISVNENIYLTPFVAHNQLYLLSNELDLSIFN
jgi:outer membrane protein assembly factor BamB